VVPRNALTALVRKIRELEKKYGFKAVCYGHAGDGNLHVNILKSGLSDDVWNGVLPEAITELFQTVVKLGGTISGEHGIGLVQKPYLHIAISDAHMNLMRGIKRTFDPHNILNPGKIFDL
jgi:glycolate oxidase